MTDLNRVLILTSAFPPTPGGAESYARTLADGLLAAELDVVVVTDGVGNFEASGDSPHVKRVSGYADAITDAGTLAWEQMYFALLRDVQDTLAPGWVPDVVLANNFETAIVGRIVADGFECPLVCSFHEHDPQNDPFGEAKMHFAHHTLAPSAVLAGSRYYHNRARTAGREEVAHLVYHGIDTELFAPTEPLSSKTLGIPDVATHLVTVGRLTARKGLIEIVEALDKISSEVPHAYLTIAGNSSSSPTEFGTSLVRKISDLGLQDRVKIRSDLGPSEIPRLLASADIVIQASSSERLGLALMEAMSCGRPIVAARNDGFAEVLGQDDVPSADKVVALIQNNDPGLIANQVLALLNDDSRRLSLGREARAYIQRNFSIDTMIDSTLRILRQAVGGGAETPGPRPRVEWRHLRRNRFG